MFKGGPVYTKIGAMVYSLAELLVPFVLIVYGTLIQRGVITSSYHFNGIAFYILMSIWMLVGVLQIIFPLKSANGFFGATARNVIYHILAGGFLVFVTGLSSPLVGSWCVFLISAYVVRNNVGIIYSISIFMAYILFDSFFWSRDVPGIILSNFIVSIITIGVSAVIVSVFQTQKVSQEKLSASRSNEFLQRDRVLTIVNNLTDAVLSIDTNGIIRIYNAASLSLLDTNDSLNGHHIDDILALKDQKDNEISIFKEIQSAKVPVKRDDLNYSYSADEQIRLEITYAPIRSSYSHSKKADSHDGYVIIMRDVTKAKSLEEERDEFISVTSHELRTPLTIAEGTLSNLQLMLDHKDVTKDMLKEAANVAHDQVIFLANMVNDLSTLSRAERGVADTAEDIDTKELAHKLHDKYAEAAKAKGLHLNLDLSPKLGTVHVSRLYLEELLQNFITNSIKYTKTGSVTIDFQKKSDNIIFAVKDTGIGISKSDQTRIFEKFFRSEDYRTRETSGTGLGLYISAKLSRKIGTKIISTSRLNFGSCFSFSLPIKKEE